MDTSEYRHFPIEKGTKGGLLFGVVFFTLVGLLGLSLLFLPSTSP
ncbi:hypothetical protein [Vibrio profundum]